MLIENFRLISVSPHLEPLEPSPMNALCPSFGDPEPIYGSLEGFSDSIEGHAGASMYAKNSSKGAVFMSTATPIRTMPKLQRR